MEKDREHPDDDALIARFLEPIKAQVGDMFRPMHMTADSMSLVGEAITHNAKNQISKEFEKNLTQLIMHPDHSSSKKFLSDFMYIFKVPDFEPGDTLGPITLVKPYTFAFNFKILSQASQLVPILQDLEFFDELEMIIDQALNHFLPYFENNMGTVLASKKSNKNKGSELSLFRYNAHHLAALFYSARTFLLIEKKNISAAEEALNKTFELRTQPNTSPNSYEKEFSDLLKMRTKALKTHQKHHRSEWNMGNQTITEITKDTLENAGDCLHYLLCAKLAALQESPNYALIECYCDLSESYSNKVRVKNKLTTEMIPFTSTAALLHKIADDHKLAGRMNSALRCYQKALKFYQNAKQHVMTNKTQYLNAGFTVDFHQKQYIKVITPLVAIQKSIDSIQQLVFDDFKTAWSTMIIPDFIESIEFETQGFAMKVIVKDAAFFKVWIQQLKQLHLTTPILTSQSQKNCLTLPSVHQLSAQKLFQTLERAQRVRQADKMRVQKRLDRAVEIEKQKSVLPAKNEEKSSNNSNNYYESSADKDLFPEKPLTVKPKKPSSATKKATAKPPAARPQVQQVSWKEDLPDYVNEDQVCPIPDPFVVNSCVPKGIFYGYIDHELVSEIDDDLLARFRDVLSHGMIAGQDNAQGIRPVQGELGHESDYLFKLNIGRQDLRLYGRKVAEQQLPNGQMVVLIAFDQAISHDQTLKLEPTNSSFK